MFSFPKQSVWFSRVMSIFVGCRTTSQHRPVYFKKCIIFISYRRTTQLLPRLRTFSSSGTLISRMHCANIAVLLSLQLEGDVFFRTGLLSGFAMEGDVFLSSVCACLSVDRS